MVDAARIDGLETVFELGTGLGILTELLCGRAGRVISVETDEQLVQEAGRRLSRFDNLQLRCCDGLGDECSRQGGYTVTSSDFEVFVSNLPYSESRRAVEHLARADFTRCVITVQREFADKLLQEGGGRRAVGVIAQYCFKISAVMNVAAASFSPPPRVDSTILTMTKINSLDTEQIRMINRIFSYRRKMLSTILRRVCGGGRGIEAGAGAGSYCKNVMPAGLEAARIDDLAPADIVGLADRILERV